ncbi:phage tail protein I [Sphingomonas phyllosphaerae]|uniref:phage tail protein I n=1 Tax=Sphingomonas phyllosphaerae TaxID=257003 RepID=UPI002413605D|nr:phage tail protein I [Sphingomonas phyllosphaerae]
MTLLPPNATALERALEAATARLGDVASPLRRLVDPDTCPAELLPYLAWAVAIDSWSDDWPERVRRARVRAAIPIQRRKGTVASIRDLIASFGGAVALREWWQTSPRGHPYTFAIVIDVAGVVHPAPPSPRRSTPRSSAPSRCAAPSASARRSPPAMRSA